MYSREGANGTIPQPLVDGCLVLGPPWPVLPRMGEIEGFQPCPDCDALGMPLAGWKECR